MSDHDDDVIIEPDTEEYSDSDALRAKLEEIKQKLKTVTKEKEAYLTSLQRMKADYINAKKRADDDKKSLITQASERIAISLIPSLDSFDQALEHAKVAEQGAAWLSGFTQIREQILSALKSDGIEAFDPTGEVFDPNAHEPVEVLATKNKSEDNMVLRTLQRGYRIGTTIIRPARVTVGRYDGNTA